MKVADLVVYTFANSYDVLYVIIQKIRKINEKFFYFQEWAFYVFKMLYITHPPVTHMPVTHASISPDDHACCTTRSNNKPRVYGAVVYLLVFAENCETHGDFVPGIRAMNFARVRATNSLGTGLGREGETCGRGSKGILLPVSIHRCD